jgi:hypothetical protein
MEKKNQLKKELFLSLSAGTPSSNWSAPKEETQGLMPPAPMAIMYRPRKNTTDWDEVDEEVSCGQSSPVHAAGIDAEIDIAAIPLCCK